MHVFNDESIDIALLHYSKMLKQILTLSLIMSAFAFRSGMHTSRAMFRMSADISYKVTDFKFTVNFKHCLLIFRVHVSHRSALCFQDKVLRLLEWQVDDL